MEITLDDEFKGTGMMLGNDKLSVSQSAGNYNFIRVTAGKTKGKWYWEYKWSKGARVSVGIISEELDASYTSMAGYFSNVPGKGTPSRIGSGVCFGNWAQTSGACLLWTNDIAYRSTEFSGGYSGCTYGRMFNENDTVGIALDLDLHQITYYINGVSQGVAIGNLPAKTYYAGIAIDSVYGGSSEGQLSLRKESFLYPIPEGFRPYDSVEELPDDPETDKHMSLLRVTMIDSSEHDYQLSDDEISDFVKWSNYHTNSDTTGYCLTKKIGIQKSSEYLLFDKIISYEIIQL